MTPVQRSESSRQAILAAALELVAEVGFAKLSIEGIASRAGVGKQTIYRWWPSKGAVLFDAVLALSEDEAGDIALPDTGDLEADLKHVLRATVDEFNDPRQDRLLRALSIEIARDPALAELYAERLDAPLHERKKARLRKARWPSSTPPPTSTSRSSSSGHRSPSAGSPTARSRTSSPTRSSSSPCAACVPASTSSAAATHTAPTAAIASASPSSRSARAVAIADTTGMPSVIPTCWLIELSPVARPCSWSGSPRSRRP